MPKDEVIVAADSRVHIGGKTYMDDDCKIESYKNKNVFAGSRLARLTVDSADGTPLIWDALSSCSEGVSLCGIFQRQRE